MVGSSKWHRCPHQCPHWHPQQLSPSGKTLGLKDGFSLGKKTNPWGDAGPLQGDATVGKCEFLLQTGWTGRWQNGRWEMPGWEVPAWEMMPRNIPFPKPFGSRSIPARIVLMPRGEGQQERGCGSVGMREREHTVTGAGGSQCVPSREQEVGTGGASPPCQKRLRIGDLWGLGGPRRSWGRLARGQLPPLSPLSLSFPPPTFPGCAAALLLLCAPPSRPL